MRIRNPEILEKAWKVFDEAKQKEQSNKETKEQAKKESNKKGEDNSKNAKEGKQKKRKISDEKENDSAEKNGEEEGEPEEPKKKKKKKNKRREGEEEENEQDNACKEMNGTATEEAATTNGSALAGECASPFKWKTTITKCLQTAPEKGLKISKLRKMVFSEYYAAHEASDHVKSETELCSLLNKKLSNRNDKYVVCKERVKLRNATD